MTQGKGEGRPALHERAGPEVDLIAPLDIAAMLRVVWYGKWLIALSTLIVVLFAGFFAFRIAQPQYAATATVQMDRGSATLTDTSRPEMDDGAINTMIAVAKSDPVLASVIVELGLLSDPEFNRYLLPTRSHSLRSLRTQLRHVLAGTSEQALDQSAIHDKTVENLQGALTIARQSNTYILRMTARSSDPKKAVELANVTARQFLRHNREMQTEAMLRAEVWLQTRVDELRAELEAQEMQAAALIATAQLQEDDGLDTLSSLVLSADQELIATRNALTLLENTSESGSARIAAEMTQLRNEISEIAARKNRLSTQLSAQSAGLGQLHQIQLQLDATRQIYQSFLRQLHENRMQQGLRTPNSQQLMPAANVSYVGPRKTLILTIAAMLGGTLGVLLVAVRHCNRKGAIDAHSLHIATGLPVLAQLSKRALRHVSTGKRAFPLTEGSDLLLAAHGLQTKLFMASRGQSAQIILSTSSIQGEGQSQLAVVLAHLLARGQRRVAIISADGSRSSLSRMIGNEVYEKTKGSWHDKSSCTHAEALGADIFVLPSDVVQASVLSTGTFAARLKALRQVYDHIVIDGPPMLLAPEAQLLASLSDAVIYSVRWASTPISIVKRGLDTLEEIDCPVTGLVLSKINPRKMRKVSSDPCIATIQRAQVI